MQEQYLKKRSELIQQQMSNQSRESFSIHLYTKLEWIQSTAQGMVRRQGRMTEAEGCMAAHTATVCGLFFLSRLDAECCDRVRWRLRSTRRRYGHGTPSDGRSCGRTFARRYDGSVALHMSLGIYLTRFQVVAWDLAEGLEEDVVEAGLGEVWVEDAAEAACRCHCRGCGHCWIDGKAQCITLARS